MANICFNIFERFSGHRWVKLHYLSLIVLWLSIYFYLTAATFSTKYNFSNKKNNIAFKKICSYAIVLVFCFLCFSTVGSGISSAANAYVAASGSADYICDGTNDHVEINKALAYVKSTGGGTVYLRGPNTYWIDGTLNIGSNTKLTGDSNAEIKLVPKAGWSSNVPMIRGDTGATNIVITGFIIDGNSETQDVPFGRSYYNLINFVDSSNIEVSNMRFEWSCNDGVQVRGGSNIVFTHNDVYKIGHDAFHILYSNNGEVAYNTVFTRTNSACRLFGGASDFTVHDNIFYSSSGRDSSTGPAIELDKTNSLGNLSFNNIEIYNNKISTMRGSGILMVAAYTDDVIRAKNVHIHNNTFTKVGQDPLNTGYTNAAITMQNFNNTIIENNVFDDGGNAAIKWHVWSGYPNHDAFVSVAQQKAQFTTYVRNNVIMNNDGMNEVTGSGVGIWNTQPFYAKFIVQSNNFYNNKNGDTYGGGFTMSNNVNTAPSTSGSTTVVNSVADEVGVYNNAGTWALWNSNTNSADIVGFGWAGTEPIAGDWNGDGVTELGIYNLPGNNFLVQSESVFEIIGLGWKGVTPVVGDWNGDGDDDVGVYNNEGTWALWNTDTNSADIVGFGWSGTGPIAGDWNGDGVTEVGIYNREGNNFLIQTDAGFEVIGLGWPGVTPVTGDWNGDGADEVGVYNNEGTWALWNTDTSSADIVGFGWSGTGPIAGDWNGDGVTELGIYNTEGNNFLIQTDSGFDVIGLGWAGVTPVLGNWG